MWFASMVLAVGAALLLLRYYAEKGTRLYVLIPVAISWSLGFFFFLVLPFDLENAFCTFCLQQHPGEQEACRACLGSDALGISLLESLVPVAY